MWEFACTRSPHHRSAFTTPPRPPAPPAAGHTLEAARLRPAGKEANVTAQGHARAVFRRAIERGNLLVAETVLRELGRPTLVELLDLTALIARKDPRRYRRVAARWMFRYLQETDTATLEDVQAVTVGLSALGGPRHDEALLALRGMAEEAAQRRVSDGVS
jgi:hypothetical protein